MWSNMVPASTCQMSMPMPPMWAQWYSVSLGTYLGFGTKGCSHSPLYSGLAIFLGFQAPLYSRFLIQGGSYSPSSSSIQS